MIAGRRLTRHQWALISDLLLASYRSLEELTTRWPRALRTIRACEREGLVRVYGSQRQWVRITDKGRAFFPSPETDRRAMKAMVQSTDVITSVDGVPCRAWKGVTEGGTRFIAYIHRCAVEVDENATEFEQLVAQPAPRELSVREVQQAFSTRML